MAQNAAQKIKATFAGAMDSMPSGQNRTFKSSVPANAIRPKPVNVPSKSK